MSTRGDIVSDLNGAILNTRIKLAAGKYLFWPFGLIPSSVASAIKGNLDQSQARTDRLDNGDLAALPDSRWLDIAKTTWSEIANASQELGAALPSFSRVLDEIVEPTAGTVVSGVKTGLPWLIALVALVAVAVISGNVRAMRAA